MHALPGCPSMLVPPQSVPPDSAWLSSETGPHNQQFVKINRISCYCPSPALGSWLVPYPKSGQGHFREGNRPAPYGPSQVSVIHARSTCSSLMRSQIRGALLLLDMALNNNSQKPSPLSICWSGPGFEYTGINTTAVPNTRDIFSGSRLLSVSHQNAHHLTWMT